MKKLFVIGAALAVAACGRGAASSSTTTERPEPPKFVADGNAPTSAVAIDFIAKFSAVIQAAIDRTPYSVKDPVEQSQAAQAMYSKDEDYVSRWTQAGIDLFTAADDRTCELYIRGAFLAWKEAYPLNGPPLASSMKSKQMRAAYANEMQGYCLSHTHLPSWGVATSK
jgi:hypothetical protein